MSHQDDQDYKFQPSDPEKIGSIHGTDTKAHDCEVPWALKSEYEDISNTVFVGPLQPTTTQEALTSEFSDCGKIINCRLFTDVTEEFGPGYAFIQFDQSSSVNKALSKYSDYIRVKSEVVVKGEKKRVDESHGG